MNLMITLFARLTWVLMLTYLVIVAVALGLQQLLRLNSPMLNLVALAAIALLVRRMARRGRRRSW